MNISSRFVTVCNIQIVVIISNIYHSFEMLLLLSFFCLMVKSGRSFKIGSHLQIAFFLLFYQNFHLPPPSIIPSLPIYQLVTS